MIATIISILFLVVWLAASIFFTVRKNRRAKKEGHGCCCGCAGCPCKKSRQVQNGQ